MPARVSRRKRSARATTTEEPEEDVDIDDDDYGDDHGTDCASPRPRRRRRQQRGGGGGTTRDMDIVDADAEEEPNGDNADSQMFNNTEHNDGGNYEEDDDDAAAAAASDKYEKSQQSVTAATISIAGTQIEDADGDTLRIMLSTDNHLGYQEDNSIRGNDSFAALEEVLYLSRHYKCDMVLLAGDLFHENRPSRRTLFKTMEIFRRYCMGPNPVQVQILPNQESDKTKNPLAYSKVNYEDESYSVDLPVFSIHGNHDDPTRDAGGTELFAALDILNIANLVNYFGKQTDTKDIRVDPICLKKGSTKVALYGLGSMRDERLNRMWRDNQIHFSKPQHQGSDGGGGDDDDANDEHDKFFNIFALHQNRDYGRGTKNAIKEDMIPEWMDLICWGHEHECKLELQESVVGTFRISQPGSSVATSLSAGEAEMKKIGLLDIRGTEFRLLALPLTQVRSFVMGSVSLAEERALDPDDPKVELKVQKLLNEKVDVMVLEADAKRKELLQHALRNGNPLAAYCIEDEDNIKEWDRGYNRSCPLKNKLENPNHVLVRLRVEHSGFTTIANQRFGATFVRSVANPDDILLFHRKKAEGRTKIRGQGKLVKDVAPLEPEQIEEGLNIEDLVVEQLDASEQKLELFDEKKICDALDMYVNKQAAQAINEQCDKLLSKQQKKLIIGGHKSSRDNEEQENDHEEVEKENEASKKESKRKKYADDVIDLEEDEDSVVNVQPKRSSGRSRSTKSSVSYSEDNSEDDDDDDVEIVDEPSHSESRSKKPSKSEKRKPRSQHKSKYYSDNEDDDEHNDDDYDLDIIDPSSEKKSRGIKSRSAVSSVASRGALSQSTLSFEPVKKKEKSSTNGRNRNRNKPYDDDSDDYAPGGSASYEDDDWGSASFT